jgi:hypothetical protein
MDKRLRTYFLAGAAAIALGTILTAIGVFAAHFAAIDELDQFGREAWTWIPRGWQFELFGQLIALTGVLLAMGGTALAFLYERTLTWARASLGALLFVGLMLIIFAIIPNQWLTLTQAVWEWTPQKTFVTIPSWLVLNNEVSISMAALKDIVSGTYSAVALGAVAVGMYQWQEWTKKKGAAPKQEVSQYGRPMTKVGG